MAFSSLSEPCIALAEIDSAYNFRIVPSSASSGFVDPINFLKSFTAFSFFNIAETIKKRPVYYPKGPNGEGQQFFKPLFNQTNANIPKSTILETISNYVKQTELPNQKVLVLSLSCTEKAMCGRISSLISRKSGLRQTDPFTSHSYGYQQPSFTRQFIKIAKNQNNITRKKINTLAYPKKIKKGKLKQSRKHAKIHAKKHVKKYAKKTSRKTFK